MPFRLTNAHVLFMNLLNRVFNASLDQCVVVMIDYILVYSRSSEDHDKHHNNILQSFKEKNLYGKVSKWEFCFDEVSFLDMFYHVKVLRWILVTYKLWLIEEVPKL